MTQPLSIAVVMPVLNEARRIDDALQHLQQIGGWQELIVVDGGSTDATAAIVAARHPNVRIILTRPGRANQMNAGAAVATADVIVFLHADVVLPATAVDDIRAALRDSATVGGAFRTWTIADGPTIAPWWAPLLHLADVRSRYTRRPYGDQAIFVRASTFARLGGYAEIPLMEDLEFSSRLAKRGKVRTVASRVEVSGRRFIARPFFYTTVVNLFPLLYRCGVAPKTLAALYGRVR